MFVGGLPPDIDEGKQLSNFFSYTKYWRDKLFFPHRGNHCQLSTLWTPCCGLASQSWEQVLFPSERSVLFDLWDYEMIITCCVCRLRFPALSGRVFGAGADRCLHQWRRQAVSLRLQPNNQRQAGQLFLLLLWSDWHQITHRYKSDPGDWAMLTLCWMRRCRWIPVRLCLSAESPVLSKPVSSFLSVLLYLTSFLLLQLNSPWLWIAFTAVSVMRASIRILSWSIRKVPVVWPFQISRVTSLQSALVSFSYNTETSKREWVFSLESLFETLTHHISILGRSQALCTGRSDLRRVSGRKMWRQVCTVFLRECDLPAVLLRTLLGDDPLPSGQGVPQAACERRRWPAASRSLPLVLKRSSACCCWVVNRSCETSSREKLFFRRNRARKSNESRAKRVQCCSQMRIRRRKNPIPNPLVSLFPAYE